VEHVSSGNHVAIDNAEQTIRHPVVGHKIHRGAGIARNQRKRIVRNQAKQLVEVVELRDQANDWTHVNSVAYDPKDGNLVVSIRNQAWVVKIAYQNGSGNLHIVWKLGQDGDFTLSTGNPLDWFSYQHDAEFQSNGVLTLFDDGNLRVHEHDGGNSRGQAWSLDEEKHTARRF